MTYRSAEDALRERTRLLEDELRSLEQTRRETSKLDEEATRLQSTLEKSKVLLERFEQKRALPMLEQVRIASPCNASWAEMVGDDRSRYCGKCEKNVYNLSAMTREDAELLMLEKEGNLCVRLYRRTDGTVITQDCPVGVRKKRLRLVGVLAIGAGAVASAAGFAAMALRTQVTQGSMMARPIAVDSAIPPETSFPEMGDIASDPTTTVVAPPPKEPPHAVMGRPSMPSAPAPPKKAGH